MSNQFLLRLSAVLLCIATMQVLQCVTDAPMQAPARICPYSEQLGPVDEFDPQYQILSPNGGELFVVGQSCSVKVSSNSYGDAVLEVVIGLKSFALPGLDGSIRMPGDSLVVFTIPEFFSVHEYDPVTQQPVLRDYSSISDSCLLRIVDYQEWNYQDYSDCYFGICE